MKLIWEFASDDPMRAVVQRQAFTTAVDLHIGSAIDAFTTAIVFAELVGNVVRHAPGPIKITLELDGIIAVLTVTDQGAGFVFNPMLPSTFSESGRGMFLVAQFAKDVSVGWDDGTGHFVRAVFALSQ